tara:strand:+ start:2275 stop:2676 length:402 start_codon:yes stop_codon:yes gene_type:complete
MLMLNSPVQASDVNQLKKLKQHSVSAYDLLKFRLDTIAMLSQQKFKDRDLAKTHFEISSIKTIEDAKHLGLQFSFSGKSKYLNEKNCIDAASRMAYITNLPDSVPKKHHHVVDVYGQLVDQDNPNLKINCILN